MFGLGKLLGKALDGIGLGWLGDVVSMGVNLMSGNWLGLIGDFSNLVQRFSDPSFTERVDREPPLGTFGQNNRPSRPFQPALSSQRLQDIGQSFASRGNGFSSFMRALSVLRDASMNQETVVSYQNNTYYNGARV